MDTKFQFHSGAIQTKFYKSMGGEDKTFQFHSGAIQTVKTNGL